MKCIKCGTENNLIQFKDKAICEKCMNEIMEKGNAHTEEYKRHKKACQGLTSINYNNRFGR